jgi:transposase
MARAGPRKVQRYSLEFKLKTVKLSQLPAVEVQAVADAVEIHPFMLSRWRKQAREGTLRGTASLSATVTKAPAARDMKRVQALQRAHAVLQQEHALLELIRFTSARRPRSSRTYRWPGVGGTWPPSPIGTRDACWPGGWGRRETPTSRAA